MTTKTRLEELRQLSGHAQRLEEQLWLLAQRADHLASQWPSERVARPGRGVPAGDLDPLNTELTRQLAVERTHGEVERARLEAILDMTYDAVLVMDATGMPLLPDVARTAGHANGADAASGRSGDPRSTRMSRVRTSPGATARHC